MQTEPICGACFYWKQDTELTTFGECLINHRGRGCDVLGCSNWMLQYNLATTKEDGHE